MKTMRLLLVVVALGAVVVLIVWNYQQRNDPAKIIASIQKGSTIPVVRLLELGERGELDAYSDELGELLAAELEAEWKPAIAAHVAKNAVALTIKDFSATTVRAETGLPANNRTQRLADIFMLSNPAENASPQIIERVARASLHFDLVRDTRVVPGRDIAVGIVVYNAVDAWTDNGVLGVPPELNEFLRSDRGISFGLIFGRIHLNGTPAPTRAEVDFGIEMAEKLESTTAFPPSRRHSRYDTYLAATPAVESLDWSDEIDAVVACTVNLYGADEQLVASWTESISGQVSARHDMEGQATAFDRLLDDALAGNSSSLDRLLALGAQGELGPFADLLGERLAASLQMHWKPLISKRAKEDLELSGTLYLEELPVEISQLLTLFFSSDPLGHASRQTWEAVAKASTYSRTDFFKEDGEAVIQHRTFTCLQGFTDDARYQGLRTGMPTIEFGTPAIWAWKETGSATRRGVSSSGRGDGPPGQIIPTEASLTYFRSREADRKLAMYGAESIPMRVRVEYALLGSNGQPIAAWTVTTDREVENPSAKNYTPLDETTPDRR